MQFTDASFEAEVLKSDKPVLVDFWAEWCGPCKALAPVIDELATSYSGKVKVGKLDTDANAQSAVRYGVSSIPTVLIFNKGELVERMVGLQAKKAYQAVLDPLVKAS